MAAYAALVSLMNNIQQIMSHPHLSSSLDNKLIQPLLEKAGFLLDFVEVYNHGGGSKAAEDLERSIVSVAHAAEDVIESHIVYRIHAGSSEVSPSCSLHLQRIINRMDVVMEKATEKRRSREEQQEQNQDTKSRALVEAGEIAMVGLDAELIQLLHELTGAISSRHIISLVGMGGIGKTTLARNVYEHLLIMHHFDIRAWTTVSLHYNVEEIVSELLSSLGKSSSTGDVDELGVELHKTLTSRRYLIILDDIWNVEIWEKVNCFLPDNENGSRVVLTTRLSKLAIDCGSSCFMMNLLDEDKCWKLFCEKAFQHEDCPRELEEVGKEIVKSCKGLPLSIVVIGGLLLNSTKTVCYWEEVAKDSITKQESLDVLSLSYTHLPPHLKPCFLYMGVFQENSEIRVSGIINLWIAEGFIRPNGTQILEEIAEGYLNDLIDRNLILVGRRRQNEKIGSCCIHDLLRDLCLKVAKQQDFLHVSENGIQGNERRLLFDRKLPRNIKLPLARSITTSNRVQQPDKFRLLRVLNEARFGSQELFENVNLRYLAFRLPNISSEIQSCWELPTSVFLIWNLQTFIIRECPLLIVAPVEIWKMRQLRHVECDQIYLPDPPRRNREEDLLMLDNLQRLSTALNLRLCEEVCNIIPNIKKLKVVYDSDLQGYDDCLIEYLCNLDRLYKLKSLKISIKGSKWPTPDSKLNKILTFPSSLNKLSLSLCKLHWEDLKKVGSLPQLEVLKLERYSVMKGDQWSPLNGQFQRLKFLKIDCCNLVYWNAESSNFPVLEKIVLRNLVSLKEIPWDMSEIPTLELIRVDRCSTSAAISAMKIKEDQLKNQGSDDLQVQVVVRESHLEILKKEVEMERLNISNMQLEISSTLVELETEFD